MFIPISTLYAEFTYFLELLCGFKGLSMEVLGAGPGM